MTTDTEHRTFLLMLDADEGQEIAAGVGFVPPGDDVQEREQRQVLKDWAVMDAEGLLPRLLQYAKWFSDLVVPDSAPAEDKLAATQSFVTFAAASIGRLKQHGMLQTPEGRRLVPLINDADGNLVDDSIPDELMEHAAEMYEWQHGGSEADE
jgi:hypothetical protein